MSILSFLRVFFFGPPGWVSFISHEKWPKKKKKAIQYVESFVKGLTGAECQTRLCHLPAEFGTAASVAVWAATTPTNERPL